MKEYEWVYLACPSCVDGWMTLTDRDVWMCHTCGQEETRLRPTLPPLTALQ